MGYTEDDEELDFYWNDDLKMEPVMVKITTERKVTTSKHRMWRQEVGDGKQ